MVSRSWLSQSEMLRDVLCWIFVLFGLYQTESSSSMEKRSKRIRFSLNLREGVGETGPSKVCVIQTLYNTCVTE